MYKDVNVEAESKLKDEFCESFKSFYTTHCNESIGSYFLSIDDVTNLICDLKLGKSTSTFIKAEHLLHSSPELACHLTILFNGLLQHGFVPTDFLKSVITPVIKNIHGDSTDPDNYRCISIGSLISQLFERALFLKFQSFLSTDDLQFGYKAKHSVNHALFMLQTCVQHYCNEGSNVFVTFMDCSKAFDKMSHNGLFLKLVQRGVPLCFLRVIMYWYLNMEAQVKWKDARSAFFKVTSGTKQGGVISPHFYGVYVDALIKILRKCGIGCYLFELFLACLMYADDLALIAPLRSTMQHLIDICAEYADAFCLTFNFKKTKGLLFGGRKSTPCNLTIRGKDIEYVEEWDYLGARVKAVDKRTGWIYFGSTTTKFYAASNSILHTSKNLDKPVLMHLLYSNCVPVITFAAEVKQLTANDMRALNTAVNDAIRHIFSYARWESVRALRISYGYDSIYELFEKRKSAFNRGLAKHGNLTLSYIYNQLVACRTVE